MKLTLFAFLGLVATSSGEDSAAPSKFASTTPSTTPSIVPSKMPSGLPSLSSMPSLSKKPSGLPSLSLSKKPSGLPSLSSMPSTVSSTTSSALPSLLPSMLPSMLPSVSPSEPGSTTEKCIEYCEQDEVTEICGGEVTGSYCELQESSDDSDDYDYSDFFGPKCPPLTCFCQCPDGGVYYQIEVDKPWDRDSSDSSDSDKVYYDHKICGRDPDCRKDGICFSPIATTSVHGKGRVMMKDLMNGDNVLTMDGSYQTMYSMNHYHKSKEVTFVQIKTKLESEQPLELSPNHLLYVEDNTNPVPASSVEVGDKVWTVEGGKEVLEINMITREGLYNPLTMDGTIIVDGIAASVYTTPTGKTHVEIDGVWSTMMKSLSFHDALHMVTAPYRQFCTSVSLDLCNLHDKKAAASSFMESFFFPFWSNQNDFMKFIIAASYVLVFGTLANLTYFKVWMLLANACVFSNMMMANKKAAA